MLSHPAAGGFADRSRRSCSRASRLTRDGVVWAGGLPTGPGTASSPPTTARQRAPVRVRAALRIDPEGRAPSRTRRVLQAVPALVPIEPTEHKGVQLPRTPSWPSLEGGDDFRRELESLPEIRIGRLARRQWGWARGSVRDRRMSTLNLKSMYNDPSQMREALAWRCSARPASRPPGTPTPSSRSTAATGPVLADRAGRRRFLQSRFGANDRGQPLQGLLRRPGLRDARAPGRRRRRRQRPPVPEQAGLRRPHLPAEDQRGRPGRQQLRRPGAVRAGRSTGSGCPAGTAASPPTRSAPSVERRLRRPRLPALGRA